MKWLMKLAYIILAVCSLEFGSRWGIWYRPRTAGIIGVVV